METDQGTSKQQAEVKAAGIPDPATLPRSVRLAGFLLFFAGFLLLFAALVIPFDMEAKHRVATVLVASGLIGLSAGVMMLKRWALFVLFALGLSALLSPFTVAIANALQRGGMNAAAGFLAVLFYLGIFSFVISLLLFKHRARFR